MNKKIRSLIDDIFSEMKMSAENLALRDELMANAQAHFDDAVAKGASEEQALQEVTESLGDIRTLVTEMNEKQETKAEPAQQAKHVWSALEEGLDEKPAEKKPEKKFTWSAMEEPEEPKQEEAAPEEPKEEEKNLDFNEAFGKAMDMLGSFGRETVSQTRKFMQDADKATSGMMEETMKQAKKLVEEADKATNGMLRGIGEAWNDASKAAGDMIGSMMNQGKTGAEPAEETEEAEQETPEAPETEEDAAQETAEPEEAAEETAAPEAEPAEAEEPAEAPEETPTDENAPEAPTDEAPADKTEDAEADPFEMDAAPEDTVITWRYPAAGLRKITVNLDDDDVQVCAGTGDTVEVIWEKGRSTSEAPFCRLEERTVRIGHENADLFRSFFSNFNKDGGKLTLTVPKGYGLTYDLHTTSGDIVLEDVDAEEVDVNSTSGSLRIAPDAGVRCGRIAANTVSGALTLSACVGDAAAKTVSGDLFVSCDAARLNADTVSGKLHAEGASDIWEINSVSGLVEVLCTVVPSGKITIGTVSAEARLSLPESIRGFVAETGSTGTIVNEFGPNRFGTCALPIRLDTLNGKLVIMRL